MSKIDYYNNIINAADYTFETDDFEVAVCYIPAENDIGIEENLDISIFNKKNEEVTWDIPHKEYIEIKKLSWEKLYANQQQDLMDEAIDRAETARLNKKLGY
jgi:hypothetical protein